MDNPARKEPASVQAILLDNRDIIVCSRRGVEWLRQRRVLGELSPREQARVGERPRAGVKRKRKVGRGGSNPSGGSPGHASALASTSSGSSFSEKDLEGDLPLHLSVEEAYHAVCQGWLRINRFGPENETRMTVGKKGEIEASVALRKAMMTLKHDEFVPAAKDPLQRTSSDTAPTKKPESLVSERSDSHKLPPLSTHALALEGRNEKSAKKVRQITLNVPANFDWKSSGTPESSLKLLGSLLREELALERCIIYRDLWAKGYFVTSGFKFGTDFLIYKSHPRTCHSRYTVAVVPEYNSLAGVELIQLTRMAASIKKDLILCYVPLKAVQRLSNLGGVPAKEIVGSCHKDFSTHCSPEYFIIQFDRNMSAQPAHT